MNLAMETALVRVVLMPNAMPEGVSGWRQLLRAAGERLAQVRERLYWVPLGCAGLFGPSIFPGIRSSPAHMLSQQKVPSDLSPPSFKTLLPSYAVVQALTDAGFTSRLRDGGGSATANAAVRAKVAERQQRLREATRRLALAWLLASTCLAGHLTHLWPAAPRFLHLLHRPVVAAATSALAMLGAPQLQCLRFPRTNVLRTSTCVRAAISIKMFCTYRPRSQESKLDDTQHVSFPSGLPRSQAPVAA